MIRLPSIYDFHIEVETMKLTLLTLITLALLSCQSDQAFFVEVHEIQRRWNQAMEPGGPGRPGDVFNWLFDKLVAEMEDLEPPDALSREYRDYVNNHRLYLFAARHVTTLEGGQYDLICFWGVYKDLGGKDSADRYPFSEACQLEDEARSRFAESREEWKHIFRDHDIDASVSTPFF